MGKRAPYELNSTRIPTEVTGALRDNEEGEHSRVREVKYYKQLISGNAIRPVSSITWHLWKLGSYSPTENGRQRPNPS
jgi:hypothetical protein